MSKLSFKNFRGFIDFPDMEFGGITFLVGKNNCGKSTFVKALLLIIDYLKSDRADVFSFDNGELGDYANIKTFERAKNKYSKDDFIEFVFQMNDFKIVVKINEKKTLYLANIFTFNFYDLKNDNYVELSNLYRSLSVTLNSETIHFPDSVIDIQTKRVLSSQGVPHQVYKNQGYNDLAERLYDFVDKMDIQYFKASLPKQSSLLSKTDKENSLAQAVHEYFESEIWKFDNPGKLLLQTWLQKDKFDIGEEIKIDCIEGEAYKVSVKKEEQWVSIADKGMGTLQLLTILLRLSCLVFRSIYSKNNSPIIIFEEPELNLHPALQSILADLFYEVHSLSKGKIKIIIETHSEYLIRRSQVLVAENKLETQPNQNPFRIHYFNDTGDKSHYKIDYDEDGILKKNFGDGFFDEASSNTLKLLRLKKAKLN